MNTLNDNKVMACVDQSDYARVVADYAAWAAQRMKAPLELLHVIDVHEIPTQADDHSGTIGLDAQEILLQQLSDEDRSKAQKARNEGRVFLASLRERALAAGATTVDMRQRHGNLQDTLAEQAAGVRLIVLGRRGESASRTQRDLGRNVERMVRAVQKPILTVTHTFEAPTSLVFAFDGSAVTRKGVEMVARSPLFTGLTVHLQMSGKPTKERQKQLDWAYHKLEMSGFEVTSNLQAGDPETVISMAIEARGANLLVMGSYSHAPWRTWLMGSKTTEMLRSARVPTLLLR